MDEGSSGTPEKKHEFLPGFTTFEDYSKALLSQLMLATKSSNGLPQEGDDYDYYSSFSGYQNFCLKMAGRVDRLISRIIRQQQLPCYWASQEEVGVASEESALEEKFETLIEANDVLLERVNMLLDDASGLRKNIDQPIMTGGVKQGTAEVASWNVKRDGVRKQMGKFKFIHSRNVPRPQVKFQEQINNSSAPFIPRLREKPNARVPLPDVYEKLEDTTSLSALIANAKEWAGSKDRLAHPYKFELENFVPLPEQLLIKEPQLPGSYEDTPFTYVDTLEKLEALKEELNSVKEFAIDLEHHSYRTYLGLTCLMQVSTRSHDYIIDTLEVWQHMHILLDPFTNPNIVKVMHGADLDMHWMQRDFSLYVVNLFDTGQASRVMELPKFSLAFLLHYCCEVEAEKQYQLADWRIRPLPAEMVHYARDDTHYLLYIYDRMRNELIRRGGDENTTLKEVLTRSCDVCLRLYEKPLFSEKDYLKLYYRHKRKFNSQQLHCLRLLYAWRDHVARDEDESPGYVLPNHMLFQISEILPREAGGVLACCNPIPNLLRQQQQEVFLLVQRARETPPTSVLPSLKDDDDNDVSIDMEMEQDTLPGQEAISGQENLSGQGVLAGQSQAERLVEEEAPVHIAINGPSVKWVEPVATVMKAMKRPLSEDVIKKLEKARQSFPDIFRQYLEAREMTPAEVLIQQQLAYENLAVTHQHRLSLEAAQQPVEEKTEKHVPGAMETNTRSVEYRRPKGKGKLSVREMQVEEGPSKAKRSRLSNETSTTGQATLSPFQPFQYKGSTYTHYTESPGGVEMFDPQSLSGANGRRESFGGSASRSRVRQKSAHKSETFASSQGRDRRSSWPRK